jgi:hypothetical protein
VRMWLSTARMALGVIAIALSLVLGFVYLISVRRLEREVARHGFGHTKAACSGARTAGGATA